MAKYKVWLTVRDRYGNVKEIDGGNISVGLDELTQEDLDKIEEQLPLDEYLKKSETGYLATDEEVAERTSIRYSDFFAKKNKQEN